MSFGHRRHGSLATGAVLASKRKWLERLRRKCRRPNLHRTVRWTNASIPLGEIRGGLRTGTPMGLPRRPQKLRKAAMSSLARRLTTPTAIGLRFLTNCRQRKSRCRQRLHAGTMETRPNPIWPTSSLKWPSGLQSRLQGLCQPPPTRRRCPSHCRRLYPHQPLRPLQPLRLMKQLQHPASLKRPQTPTSLTTGPWCRTVCYANPCQYPQQCRTHSESSWTDATQGQ